MRVSIIGAGYVGLVTAACFAERGHNVVCVDLDRARVDQIEAGVSPIHEPGLAELLERTAGRRLHATTSTRDAVLGSDLTFIAVGTPFQDGRLDLGAVSSAAEAIGDALADKGEFHVVVVKSTVIPGTTTGVVRPLLESRAGKTAGESFGLGVNPEFLTEGQAVSDFQEPDRIVLGALDERTLEVLERLYADFPAAIPRVRTNPATAEMIKYASNALLATMISFSNEIGNLSAAIEGVDVVDVLRGVHASRYLTSPLSDGTSVEASIVSFLEAGSGFGGSCLPKDVRALVSEGERQGRPMRVLRAVLETNEAQADEVLRIVESGLGGLEGQRVTVLGLAFKPDTDDVRETPALPIVERLLSGGAVVTIHDPVVSVLPPALAGRDVRLTGDLTASLRGADAIVLVTRWAEYERVPELLQGIRPAPFLVDGRRMLPKGSVERYAGIGV